MGQLIDGVWHDTWYDTKSSGGNFSVQRRLSATGLPLTARPDLPAKADSPQKRSLPSVRFPCLPWAHRTLIFRKLKGLEPFIPVSVVNPLMLENGWTFDDNFPAATGDTLYQHEFLYQLYLHADPHYSGRVTVPVLWDKKIILSSAMSPPKSFVCLTPPSMGWALKPGITIPRAAKQN